MCKAWRGILSHAELWEAALLLPLQLCDAFRLLSWPRAVSLLQWLSRHPLRQLQCRAAIMSGVRKLQPPLLDPSQHPH